MPRYPFCVLDIDGTLTTALDTYEPALGDLVNSYRETKGTVALLSGRLPSGMIQAARLLELPAGTLLGGADGSVLMTLDSSQEPQLLFAAGLQTDQVLPTCRDAALPGLAMTPTRVIRVMENDRIMTRLATITAPDVVDIPSWDQLPETLADEPLTGLRFILERAAAMGLIVAFSRVDEGETEVFDNQEFTHQHVGFSIRPVGCNKGSMLRRMMERAGFSPDQTAVFGDWITDIPMFREAGYSCAPADALAAVRNAATKVSAHTIREAWLRHELPAIF